jgi:hypothetical protein
VGTVTRGSSQDSRYPPRRVLLLSESAGLGAVLGHLLDDRDRLSRLGSLRELAETRGLDAANMVVLDVPREDRAAAVGQARRRYLGPLVVLVAKEDRGNDLRLDDACTLLARPFSAEELAAALAIPVPDRPAAEAVPAPQRPQASPAGAARAGQASAAGAGATANPKAAARQAPFRPAPTARTGPGDLVDRAQRLLVALTQGWQARRRVRVAGFSAFALVAFTIAFALAAQGRCGPGCDALGTGFSPAPTIAPSESSAPSTTGPKRASTTTAPGGSPGTGAFRGASGGRLATTSTAARSATTTTRKPGSGGGNPGPTTPTTRPPTTPTTAPPTTETTATTDTTTTTAPAQTP